MAEWIKKKVLVTVKAYPQPSKKHQETVCTAGICLDTKQWIRMYPVPFRYLEDNKQFKKYDVLDVEVSIDGTDGRPESHKIRGDTLTITENISSDDNWKRRKDIVLPTLSTSMCQIIREQAQSKKSLGAFKLKRPKDFQFKAVDPANAAEDDGVQLSLFDDKKKKLERLPYDFKYKYTCEGEPSCNGHVQKILDWELGEAYRQWTAKYGSEEEGLKKIKQKWLDEMFADDKDSCVFVGNHHLHRDKFMILGVFYPKYDGQLNLFG